MAERPDGGEGEAAEGRYFQQIETRYSQLRGRALLLSPRDVALVDDWWAAGVPVRVVLETLNRVFEKRRESDPNHPGSVHSLSYCRHAVEEAFDDWKELQLGRRVGADAAGPDPGEAREFLRARAAVLRDAATRAQAPQNGPLLEAADRLHELAEALGGAQPPSLTEVEEQLEDLEDELLDRLLEGLDPEFREPLEEESRAELEPLRGRLTERAYQASLLSGTRARLRERQGLPRLSLYLL